MRASYEAYLASDDWKQKRTAKLARTKRCAICASRERLDVHHLEYRDLYNVTLSDLRVLCRRCHDKAHELMRARILRFAGENHHGRFALTKTAVKKALGLTGVNMFR